MTVCADESDWLPVPEWSNSIVSGKSYSTDSEVGAKLLRDVTDRIPNSVHFDAVVFNEAGLHDEQRYAEYMTKHRLGQGAFRVLVTEAYDRRCSITGEKTLPVLQAAHIKPYGKEGPHVVQNGILLKSDFHITLDCFRKNVICTTKIKRDKCLLLSNFYIEWKKNE